jgi:uncharacterized membrane protein YqhA
MPGRSKIMNRIFNLLRFIITAIALLVFVAGVALSLIGIYEFLSTFFYVNWVDKHNVAALITVGLLKGVDLFLMAIVFFVFSLGIMILFTSPDNMQPVKLPEWLRIKNFIELKVILWEAILTTLVISFLASLAEKKMAGESLTILSLVGPGVILLISLSLYFLKKGEK